MFNQLLRRWRRRRLPSQSTVATKPLPTAKPTIVDVTDDDFPDIVLGSDKLAVVDFWAEWCQPCTVMAAYMEFLAQEFGEDLLLAAIDVDENSQTPERYTVMGLPTLLIFRDGQEIDRIMGIEEYQSIKTRVEWWFST